MAEEEKKARRTRPSFKTLVIETIFFDRWNEEETTVTKPIVTNDDITKAMTKLNIAAEQNQKRGKRMSQEDAKELGIDAAYAGASFLSTKNPANFLKDIVRKPTRNAAFPASVLAKGYTAKQTSGDQSVFQFIPLAEGQTEAFQERAIDKEAFERIHEIQTISLNISSRRLGRRDESWLTSVVANLKLVETHLALHREEGHEFRFLEPLQTNMKLRSAEIDALYLGGIGGEGDELTDVIVCCEMKHKHEVLEEEQIQRGAKAAKAEAAAKLDIDDPLVIPMGIKVVNDPSNPAYDGLLRVIEYEPEFEDELTWRNETLYRLVPPVPGVNV